MPLLCGALLVMLFVFLIISGITLIPRSVSAARKGKKNVSKAETEETELLLQEEFLGKISLSFHQNDDGEVYIDGSCDIVTGILKALYTCSGYKDMEE